MKKTESSESSVYERAGRATFLPGLIFAIELLESKRDELQAYLDGTEAPEGERVKRKYIKKTSQTYWDKLTPEQRSEEMRRRHEIRKATLAQTITGDLKPNIVFVPPTPEPAAPAKKRSDAGGPSKWWASLTEEQKLAHKKKMSVGLKKRNAAAKKAAQKLANAPPLKKPLVNGAGARA